MDAHGPRRRSLGAPVRRLDPNPDCLGRACSCFGSRRWTNFPKRRQRLIGRYPNSEHCSNHLALVPSTKDGLEERSRCSKPSCVRTSAGPNYPTSPGMEIALVMVLLGPARIANVWGQARGQSRGPPPAGAPPVSSFSCCHRPDGGPARRSLGHKHRDCGA